MLGSVAGDIIGSPYEWNNTDDRYFDLCHSTRGWYKGREVSFHPKYTADTVMTLAVARWLMQDEGRHSSQLLAILKESCEKDPGRGYSPSFLRWAEKDDPQPMNNYGNACAVRVSPVGLVASSLPEALSLARQQAEVTHIHPEAVKGAQAIAQAVWMAHHGRTKEDIRFATEQEFGYDLTQDEGELSQLLKGCVREPVIVNGEDTGGYYLRDTGRFNSSCQDTVPAAIMAFLKGDSFEEVVRRAVAMGGDSNSIASMAGAIAEPFFGGVPEKIRGLCERYITPDIASRMELFERVAVRKDIRTGKTERTPDDSFRMIIAGEAKAYVVPTYRTDIADALKVRFGEGVEIISPRQLEGWKEAHCHESRSGTFVEGPRADVRTLYYKDGKFMSPTTYPFKDGEPEDVRKAAFSEFQKMKEYAQEVKNLLQQRSGFHGEGNVHYGSAYFPVILHSSIEVWKGETFAGSIGIDPQSGLLKIREGGDLGPCEYGEDRCFNVFYGTGMDAFKDAIGYACLDEGVGLGGENRMLNSDRAYRDVCMSRDEGLDRGTARSQVKPSR